MDTSALLGLFLPLFVAMDPLGVFPAFIQLTSELSPTRRKKVVDLSILTAGLVGLFFIPFGPWLLRLLGLQTGDFQVAGGLLVLVVALRDVVWEQKMMSLTETAEGAGIVPFGIPLLVGPAVFATLVLLGDRYSMLEVSLCFLANLMVSWVVFRRSEVLMKWMGSTGSRVVSKLASLLLAAYAVMMIRSGLQSLRHFFQG
jgi:multiple antibiotic resistance protein